MPDSDEALERRLAAVERALDELPNDGSAFDEPPERDGRGEPPNSDERPDDEALQVRLATLESRVDELDAAVQSIRGFLGGVSAVNEAVERRADAAIAAVDRLERRLDGAEGDDESTSIDHESTPADSDIGTTDPESTSSDPGSTHTDKSGLKARLRDLR